MLAEGQWAWASTNFRRGRLRKCEEEEKAAGRVCGLCSNYCLLSFSLLNLHSSKWVVFAALAPTMLNEMYIGQRGQGYAHWRGMLAAEKFMGLCYRLGRGIWIRYN